MSPSSHEMKLSSVFFPLIPNNYEINISFQVDDDDDDISPLTGESELCNL